MGRTTELYAVTPNAVARPTGEEFKITKQNKKGKNQMHRSHSKKSQRWSSPKRIKEQLNWMRCAQNWCVKQLNRKLNYSQELFNALIRTGKVPTIWRKKRQNESIAETRKRVQCPPKLQTSVITVPSYEDLQKCSISDTVVSRLIP